MTGLLSSTCVMIVVSESVQFFIFNANNFCDKTLLTCDTIIFGVWGLTIIRLPFSAMIQIGRSTKKLMMYRIGPGISFPFDARHRKRITLMCLLLRHLAMDNEYDIIPKSIQITNLLAYSNDGGKDQLMTEHDFHIPVVVFHSYTEALRLAFR